MYIKDYYVQYWVLKQLIDDSSILCDNIYLFIYFIFIIYLFIMYLQ
jgi:hypothetical protein